MYEHFKDAELDMAQPSFIDNFSQQFTLAPERTALLIIDEYKNSKDAYQKHIKEFHKRFIKLVTRLDKAKNFSVSLIGFDGTEKAKLDTINIKKIFTLVDKMPMNKMIKDKSFKPLNLSLFSDYKPETTLHGLGFRNKEKALYTVKAIKKRSIKYQVNVIATMLGRAKNHPNKTKDMDDAIRIFDKWMKDYKRSKNK